MEFINLDDIKIIKRNYFVTQTKFLYKCDSFLDMTPVQLHEKIKEQLTFSTEEKNPTLFVFFLDGIKDENDFYYLSNFIINTFLTLNTTLTIREREKRLSLPKKIDGKVAGNELPLLKNINYNCFYNCFNILLVNGADIDAAQIEFIRR